MAQKETLAQEIARLCAWKPNKEYEDIRNDALIACELRLPSGSGFDNGSKIDVLNSNGQKIIINTSFHHLSENGYYTGWTNHKVICTPQFSGVKIVVTGRDKNDIKDYIYQTFSDSLEQKIKQED
jgi:hypothetical protein